MTNWLEKPNARCCPSIWRAGLAHYGAGCCHLHAGRADRHGGHQRGRVHRGHKTLPRPRRAGAVAYATGSEDVDALLNGVTANLDALHKLNDEIPDKQLSDAMDRMEKAGRSIADTVARTPDKARNVDRFARYYLPEMVKLMALTPSWKSRVSRARTLPRSKLTCAATPIPPPPPLKTCWTRCTAPRQWIFRPTSRYWTAS